MVRGLVGVLVRVGGPPPCGRSSLGSSSASFFFLKLCSATRFSCSLLARPFRRLPVFARLGAGAW